MGESSGENGSGRMRKMESLKGAFHSREFMLLKKLTRVPRQMDPVYQQKICGK